MTDYQGNSRRSKEKAVEPEKNIEKVIAGEVVVQKKSLGRKIKDLFVEADFKSVVRYVTGDVLLPAARNMIVDASTKGIERVIYGESAMRRRSIGGGTRFMYHSPINRGPYREAPPSRAPGGFVPGPRRQSRDDLILSSREEAELVVQSMNDIVDQYDVVSVADLNDLVGLPTSHTDNRWGWNQLGNLQIRQIREGYLIDFPPAEPIQ